jgi:hypothetical protein
VARQILALVAAVVLVSQAALAVPVSSSLHILHKYK